jgi:Flp pilus assembly protein TadG
MKALWAVPNQSLRKSGASTAHRAGILRSESGTSLVEMALLTSLLLTLLIAVIDLGRYAYLSILVGNAARAGAAFGAQGLAQSADTTDIRTAANNDFQNNGQGLGSLNISSSVSCGCDNMGTVTAAACTGCGAGITTGCGSCASGHWVVMVSVTASGTFGSLFNYPGIPSSITVSRTSTMRVAQQ